MDRHIDLARRLHRIAAALTGLYLLVHLVNHLMALKGIAAHIAFMQGVRTMTRVPAVEALLLAAVALQAGSGQRLLWRRRGQRRLLFDRLQALSGAYLAFFLLVHVVSVLLGRTLLRLDTNFYYAAAGLQVRPWPLFFVPYYGLAVAALFVHLACALRRLPAARMPLASRERLAWGGIAFGAIMAVLIVAAFSGAFYAIALPLAYRATFS
jgi:succinate dehydrogenase/fumarate reductase cytochrome b subunit